MDTGTAWDTSLRRIHSRHGNAASFVFADMHAASINAEGVAWRSSGFECGKDSNTFKDDVRVKLIKLIEKSNARYVRINFGKRPDNEKLILAEIDIWQ